VVEIPEFTNRLVEAIDAAHESRQGKPRPHMGVSMIGDPCDRRLWLSFRWAVQEKFSGRLLRLFRRGHQEEISIIQDLRDAGLAVMGTNGYQEKVDFGSHVSGSIDGIITSGVPEAPNKKHIAEFKTHSLKSFNDLVAHGVQKSKPLHYTQMQGYMHGTRIDRALYVAVCKDDDRIHTERVKYDKEVAEKAINRARRIALEDRMPPPLTTDPTWFQCRFCPAHEFCHETKLTKHVNCRTCAHSTAKDDSTWRCELNDSAEIPIEFQHEGCVEHVLHPDLVPWQRKAGENEWSAVYVIDGKDVQNGSPDVRVFSSKEILANPSGCASDNPIIKAVRETFPGAEIVG
jgi:hypothetical protein